MFETTSFRDKVKEAQIQLSVGFVIFFNEIKKYIYEA